jgi:phosphate:Na+ symporter
VAFSHLTFNAVTGVVAFFGLPAMVWGIKLFFDIDSNSVVGLALFHTMFNVLGVILFLPFIGLLTRMLVKIYPDRKKMLTVYVNNTPTEVTDAAATALRKEVGHLFQESQLYILRLLRIDEKLVLDNDSPFEKNRKKKLSLPELYENIKLLHSEIFAFYSRLQTHRLEETEAKELERVIYASRNIMNSIKNFKGIRQNMEEFDGSENPYLNAQYKLFRKRLIELYHDTNRVLVLEDKEEQYRKLLTAFVLVEENDKRFIKETMKAVSEKQIQDIEISSLLLVNRLFTQACRMQIFSTKDLFLSSEQIHNFDRALDMKEIMDEGKTKALVDPK